MVGTFHRTYEDSRKAFIAAAEEARAKKPSLGIGIHHYQHAKAGQFIGGQQMAADLGVTVVTHGPEDAKDVIVTTSGMHGVELFVGAALQTRWLKAAGEVGSRHGGNVRFVHVHALNPVGSSLYLRTDENNVDCNRNFLPDYAAAPALPQDYTRMKGAIIPRTTNPLAHAWAWGRIGLYVFTHSFVREKGRWLPRFDYKRGTMAALELGAGQYDDPDGVSYGGRAPNWTQEIWRVIAEEHCAHAGRIAHIDLHSMLGERGKIQLMHSHSTGSDESQRIYSTWAGEDVQSHHPDAQDTKSLSPSTSGSLVDFWEYLDLQSKPKVAAVTAEIGTVHEAVALQTFRRRYFEWVRYEKNLVGAQTPRRSAMNSRTNFLNGACPADQAWEQLVIGNADRLFYKAVDSFKPAAVRARIPELV